jgi:hypothetical protein
MNWVHILIDIIIPCLFFFFFLFLIICLRDTLGIVLILIAIAFGLYGRTTCTQYDSIPSQL